jgi:hypothetical protein
MATVSLSLYAIVHHQCAKLQGYDIKITRQTATIPLSPLAKPDTVIAIEDFGYGIRPWWEHQSRYFSSLGVTLYGIIIYINIDSCLHLTEEQRDELHDLMDKHDRPHYVINSTIHVSSDMNHDSAATMHFNDVKFTPWLKEITRDSIRRRVRITHGGHGAASHMKSGHIALWIAKQHQLNGIIVTPLTKPPRMART